MNEKKLRYTGFNAIGEEKAKAEKARLLAKAEARAKQNANGGVTNDVFAATNDEFKAACEKAGVPATARQAGKFRRKAGRAYEAHIKG